jgi:hypothetical protein
MQYFNSKDLLDGLKLPDVKSDDLISTDSYNEEELVKKIKLLDNKEQLLLLKCAIHISIVGSGNKTYGLIRDGDEVLEIKSIFDRNNVKYNKTINQKYEKNDLSARRIQRLFRYHIQKFIINTGRSSYLWRKYANSDIKMIPYCFPGAEHLIETNEQMNYLYNAYKNLDSILNTKFIIRMERVFIARNLIKTNVEIIVLHLEDRGLGQKEKSQIKDH